MLRAGTLHHRIPATRIGAAEVIHDSPDPLTRLRAARDGQPLRAQTYTRLFVDNELWMTDAEFECYTNAEFLSRARGDVLIAGLGLGLILGPLLESKSIISVTVIERSRDVISLIGPIYAGPKLTIVEADAGTWKAPKKAFDLVYLDIWANVPNGDNAKEISTLKKRYRPALKTGGRTMAWCEDLRKTMKGLTSWIIPKPSNP